MWHVLLSHEMKTWIETLDDSAKIAVRAHAKTLAEVGPSLDRPYVDTVKRSKHSNMKELRIQNKRRVYRILFAFDPKRRAILLAGGDILKPFYNQKLKCFLNSYIALIHLGFKNT